MRIVRGYADTATEWNCSEWRDLAGSDAINAAAERGELPNWSCKLIHCSAIEDYLNPVTQDIIARADILVLQRNVISQTMLDAINYFQGLGTVCAVDLDDAYPLLRPQNPAWFYWILDKANRHPLEYLEKGIRMCNALISPNRNILADWSYAAQGYHLPNYARGQWWKDLPTRAEIRAKSNIAPGRIVIGWGGSVSHYDSWWGSGIRQAAERVCRRHPEVLWLLCGNDPRLYAQLPVPMDQKAMQPGVAPDLWPKVVKLFDIGVAPLFGPYDQRRSWIKGMEYLLAGVPWVGVAGEPYRDLAQWGTLIPEDSEAWEAALEGKIAHLQGEQEAAAERIPMAQDRLLIENNLGMYGKVYQEIIQNAKADTAGALSGIYKIIPTAEPAAEGAAA